MKRILIMVAALDTLGALFAALSSTAAADTQSNAAAAENRAAMYIGCHAIPDYKASFPKVYRVPCLGGQNAEYIESALYVYQKGDRRHPTMRAIVGLLTGQDIVNFTTCHAAQTSATQNNPQK